MPSASSAVRTRPTAGAHLNALVATVTLVASVSVSAQSQPPGEWLERMSDAVSGIDFEGTVIRERDGQSQTLKVARKIVDGVTHEKLISQEGNGIEIIRNGSEVHCILPDKQSVLVEYWDDDVTLFSSLPHSDLQSGNEYDLSLVREDRVAGRRAMILAVRPHDGYRYGHRIWLDTETAFPLRAEILGSDGALIEQLKFADVRLGATIAPEALEPSFDLDNFTWYPEPAKAEAQEIESDWVSDDLPRGFRQVSATKEHMGAADTPVEHLMYTDGLANVSVFIAELGEDANPPRGVLGGSSNSHSVERDGRLITAIGDVPPATVRRIATSMRHR